MQRRRFLSSLTQGAVAASAAWVGPAHAAAQPSSQLERIDLKLPGKRSLARRALVLRPKSATRPTRGLILLHGLGETGDEIKGIGASGDPYHGANEALSRALDERGIKNRLLVLPGPHNQPWLREAGSIAMLDWHDRKLNPPRRDARSR